jgi:hypothetical protein
MNKLDRQRRLARDRKRRYRARLKEKQAEVGIVLDNWYEPRPSPPPIIIPQVKHVCEVCGAESNFNYGEKWYCAQHGADAASKPPESTRPVEPTWPTEPSPTAPPRRLFDTASDRFRPAWWAEVDPNPQPIELNLSPRSVRRTRLIESDGSVFPGPAAGLDPGIYYSPDTGHVDIAAEIEKREEKKRRDSRL